MRSDASKNRQVILDAARKVFAEHGAAVPIDRIAELAGVGAGTLYRHFPTKEALFAAVVTSGVEDVVRYATAQAERSDAGTAFFDVLARMLDEGLANKAVKDAMSTAAPGAARPSGASAIRKPLQAVLTLAQQRGDVRDDVTVDDVLAVVTGTFRAYEQATSARSRRMLFDIMCRGLKATR